MNALLQCLGLKRKEPLPVKEDQPQRQSATAKEAQTAPPTYKWKFIDANAFIYQGVLKLHDEEDFHELDFTAISYTWSPNMLEWRKWILDTDGYPHEEKKTRVPSGKSASEDMERFHLFFTVVCFLVLARGGTFFWMDVLCIDQDSDDEKAFFVPKMGSLYASAVETHVYLTGSMFVTMSSKELHSPIWETRAWTLQEYIKSKNVVYCYCFSGDVMQDIKALTDSRMPSRTVELRAPILDKYKSTSSDNAYMLQMATKDRVTCYFENDSPFGPQISMTSYMKTDMWGPDTNKIIGRSTLGKSLYSMKHEASKEQTISMTMVLLAGRMSTYPEDMMYSVLGLLEMEDYQVQYKIGFEEAKAGVFEKMKPDVLSMVLGSDWASLLEGKYKDSALPRVMGSEPTIGIDKIKITNSSKYTRTVGTEVTSRKERFRVWKDLSRRQTENFSVVRATMGSQTSRLMIMFCASLFDNPEYAYIPTSEIPEENIRPVILSGVAKLTDEEYHDKEFKYDRMVDLVEIAVCRHYGLLTDPRDQQYMSRTALLALQCEESPIGCLTSKGAVLILDAYALSGNITVNVIE
ncbi:hypothetical protein CPB84DRAFT_1759203 [Gymnopilus junonius]|uniref:Heterokaryon incompatibility domain-containing protein n=1 Tax=Gymnopilus junonius TaxID=109634 RepID=A0A9P5TW75_GYMJU|nr:hypothetical protein CPB84DRAFT_1759203 [Gymnopilus junonius]